MCLGVLLLILNAGTSLWSSGNVQLSRMLLVPWYITLPMTFSRGCSHDVDWFRVCYRTHASCDGAKTKQLNISELHDLYGRACMRSDLSFLRLQSRSWLVSCLWPHIRILRWCKHKTAKYIGCSGDSLARFILGPRVHWCYVDFRILSDLSSRITYHTYACVDGFVEKARSHPIIG